MRAASVASVLLIFALLLNTTTAEDPLVATASAPAGQPSEEERTEIEKIRAALGPEFRIASKMFGDDLPTATPAAEKSTIESDLADACSPASSFYLGTTPPSLERAVRFLSLAESDLKSLCSPAVVRSDASRNEDNSAEEVEQLHAAAQKCRELADQFEQLAKLRANKTP